MTEEEFEEKLAEVQKASEYWYEKYKKLTEQRKARAEEVQAFINETKEKVYKGELNPSLYFSTLAGFFTAELIGVYDYSFNTDLELEKIGGNL